MLQFKSILDLIRTFSDEQSCINHLEQIRWNGKIISPFDKTSKVYKCKGNKYRCKNTGKYFNVRTNTIFEGTKISLQNWFIAIYLFTSHKRGISSYQLARDLNVTQKTAWFILQRLRYSTEHESFLRELNGIVQCDETFVGGKNKNRHRDKKVPMSQGRSFKDKTPVFGAIEKGGLLRARVIANTSRKAIQPLVHEFVNKEAYLMTDEWKAYKGLERYYNHSFVDHGRKQYADGDTTTNAIENFWSHFKRSIIGVYYHASRKHLQQYVNESVFRFNTRNTNINVRFDMLLETTNEKRLTYKSLTNA
ncbi:ISXO2-like transposase domain protein [compost metagenome]